MSKGDCYCYANPDKIVCPYCYEEFEDDDYYVIKHCSNHIGKDKCECPYCGKEFFVFAEACIEYTSTRIGENGEEIDTWEDDDDEND